LLRSGAERAGPHGWGARQVQEDGADRPAIERVLGRLVPIRRL
jgi:hypothetical protein